MIKSTATSYEMKGMPRVGGAPNSSLENQINLLRFDRSETREERAMREEIQRLRAENARLRSGR